MAETIEHKDVNLETGTEVAKRVDSLHPEQPAQLPATTPAHLLQIAVEQGADLDKLEKLMDLQERWEANEARKAYVVAMANFKREPPTLIKNKHVKFGTTEYDHATLDQVSTLIGAGLGEYGLSHDWKIDQQDGGSITVTCVITHEAGHSERTTMKAGPDTSGAKNSIQAIASTVTYLERYTLLAATGLAAKGQDDDGGDSDEKISEEQKQRLIDKQREVGADTRKFLTFLGLDNLDQLPADRFDEAMRALDMKGTAA